ncbi:SIP domain-containing protein [Brucella pseudogrignonensis]|uniref:siderophore-interacting protein n=1 Tax=Brucella pseudogrignonensis TaxID=419475 RepID=UPI0019098DFB|nr:SIP domain-containing protein [Brucella pseudogrignonensis]MBK0022846.1 SIP domain-containing protein [Ochrobactrum sp. S45]MBK0044861.1 SIP domain-containing protein [Ochrobactrum sp. S46]UKK95385.1 SIP domain-containing protein [Brucella pseudogrignonensis]
MIRIVLGGEELRNFRSTGVPDEFIWLTFVNGDGTSGGRYYTVRHWNGDSCELTVDFVRHDTGIGTKWAQHAIEGDMVEIYLPRSRFAPPSTGDIILLGDYSALPAIARIVDECRDRRLIVHAEIPGIGDRLDLGRNDNLTVNWQETFGKAQRATQLLDIAQTMPCPEKSAYIWIAGEAKAVAECRKHFRTICNIHKDQITAVGYWIEGQARV